MIGFLFWIFLVVSLGFIIVGVFYYIKDKEHQNIDDNNNEVRIWGLKASTFYGISMASLIILFLLYENPVSVKWDEQRKIDEKQSTILDSLQRENDRLKQDIGDLRKLLDLHNQLDERLINASEKKNVIIVNNRPPRHKPCKKDTSCCDSVSEKKCLGGR